MARNNAQNDMYKTSFDEDDEEIEIDVGELFSLIKKKLFVIILLIILGGGIAAAYTEFLISPTYSSSGTIYLTPLITESGVADYSSQTSNSKLVNNVMSLLKQNNLMSRVAEVSGVSSAEKVKSYLNITNETDTEIITIEATTNDPRLSKKVATNTINIFIETMQDNLNVKNIEIVDSPKLSFEPVGPNLKKNVLIGCAGGFVIGAVYIVILLLTDNRLKSKEQAEKYLGLPVLCEIPKIK